MKTVKLAVAAAAILASFGATYQLASAEIPPSNQWAKARHTANPASTTAWVRVHTWTG